MRFVRRHWLQWGLIAAVVGVFATLWLARAGEVGAVAASPPVDSPTATSLPNSPPGSWSPPVGTSASPRPSQHTGTAGGGAQSPSAVPTRSAAPAGSVPQGPGAGQSAGAASPSASPSKTPNATDLQGALLAASEVPGGAFTAQPPSAASGIESSGYCARLTQQQPDALDQVQAVFQGGSSGPFVVETLVQFVVPDAQTMIAQLVEAPVACGTLSTVVLGFRVRLSLTPLAPPRTLGDQTVGLQVNITFTDYGVTTSADIAAVRHGGTVIVVTNAEFPEDTSLTWQIAAAAYTKVAARW